MSELISCPKEDPYNYDLVLITQLDQSRDILKEKKRERKFNFRLPIPAYFKHSLSLF